MVARPGERSAPEFRRLIVIADARCERTIRRLHRVPHPIGAGAGIRFSELLPTLRPRRRGAVVFSTASAYAACTLLVRLSQSLCRSRMRRPPPRKQRMWQPWQRSEIGSLHSCSRLTRAQPARRRLRRSQRRSQRRALDGVQADDCQPSLPALVRRLTRDVLRLQRTVADLDTSPLLCLVRWQVGVPVPTDSSVPPCLPRGRTLGQLVASAVVRPMLRCIVVCGIIWRSPITRKHDDVPSRSRCADVRTTGRPSQLTALSASIRGAPGRSP